MSPPHHHFLQHHDFKGLTCKLFRNMDLRSIFGLYSRFGVVWGGLVSSTFASLALAEKLCLSKSKIIHLTKIKGRKKVIMLAGVSFETPGTVALEAEVSSCANEEKRDCSSRNQSRWRDGGCYRPTADGRRIKSQLGKNVRPVGTGPWFYRSVRGWQWAISGRHRHSAS
jgi:hypothetical protein